VVKQTENKQQFAASVAGFVVRMAGGKAGCMQALW